MSATNPIPPVSAPKMNSTTIPMTASTGTAIRDVKKSVPVPSANTITASRNSSTGLALSPPPDVRP